MVELESQAVVEYPLSEVTIDNEPRRPQPAQMPAQPRPEGTGPGHTRVNPVVKEKDGNKSGS
jgi:hypothetical protein